MSWVDRLNDISFTITCGDGKKYSPLWKSGEKSKDFNTAKYEFINSPGSLIERRQPQSNLYPLVFWFQGIDNIEQCDRFEESANDNRAWTIEHPFYGTLKGQPVKLKRKDTSFNVTEVNIDFWESIEGEFPEDEISIQDQVLEKASAAYEASLVFFSENSSPSSEDVGAVKENVALVSSKFKPDKDSFNDYINVVSASSAAADRISVDTKDSFEAIQGILKSPAFFNSSSFSKLESFLKAYTDLKIPQASLFNKYDFEAQAATAIAATCISVVNPQEGDYVTRGDIERVSKKLSDLYGDYLLTLDSYQVGIYEVETAWMPTVQIQNVLSDLVSFTSRSLFLLSFNVRQERTIELKKDSNLILIAHRFMGLDVDDKNIEALRKINGIKNNELFKLKIGRSIKYFV